MEVGDTYERIGGEVVAMKGIRTLQEDQQSQLAWILVLSETAPPTKEHTQAFLFILADVQLGIHMGPKQL